MPSTSTIYSTTLPDDDAEPAPTVRTTITVYLSLFAAVGIAIFLIATIGIRWMTQRTPSSILVFHADASLTNGTITILGGDGVHERVAQIADSPDFTTPIFLEPGTYTLTVKHAGSVAYHDMRYVAEGCRYDIDLTHSATTQP